jgi:hypothetical protein
MEFLTGTAIGLKRDGLNKVVGVGETPTKPHFVGAPVAGVTSEHFRPSFRLTPVVGERTKRAMWPRRTSRVLLVALALIALAPLAHATPPDPTWFSGFWDDSDHDDVVILASSENSIANAQSHSRLRFFFASRSALRAVKDELLSLPPAGSHGPRAPPAVQSI